MELKKPLTCAPILKVSDMKKDFLVCIYASKDGSGAMLMQKGGVVVCISCKLKKHEIDFPAHDLEFAIIVMALKL
jgi:hypothetical protein